MPSSPLQRVLVNKTTNATFSPSKQQSAGLVAGGKENLVSKLISDWADIHSAVVAGCKRSIDQMDSDRESPTAKRPTIEFQIYSKDGINRTDAVRKLLGWDVRPGPRMEHEDDSDSNQDIASETDKVNNSRAVFQGHNHAANSQLPTPVPATVNHPRPQSSIYPSEPVAYKAFINEKATLLRVRLGLAVKKLENKWKMDRLVAEIEARGPHTRSSNTTEGSPARPHSSAQLLPPIEIASSQKESSAPQPPPMLSAVSSMSDMTTVTGSRDSESGPYEDQLPTPVDDPSSPPLPEIQKDGAPVIIQRGSSRNGSTGTTKRGEAVDGLLKLMETTAEFDDLDVLPGE